MRRDTFLKSLAALAAAGACRCGPAAANLKMMIPANPGGGWDSTGRALGKALQEAGVATSSPTTTRAARPAPSAWRSSSTPARATATR
jgi:tripartite-type tricarboxylate transporter receptor subunit TctC